MNLTAPVVSASKAVAATTVQVVQAADKRFDFAASFSAAIHSVWAVSSGVIAGILTVAASTSFNDGSLVCSGAFASAMCTQSFIHHGLYGVAAGVLIGTLVRGTQRSALNQKIQSQDGGSNGSNPS
jgi:hypothetical protein